MSRWKAASIHLGVSIFVVLVLGILLLTTWYPPNFARAAGGLYLILILASVDACIGPLLTMIVFKVGKPGLKFDLTVIILLQLAAMGYGLYSIYWARPVFLVFAVDRFELINASEISKKALTESKYPEYRTLSLMGPVTVAIRRPNDPEERKKMLFELIPQGLDYKNFPKYYVPYTEMMQDALLKAKAPADWKPNDPKAHSALAEYLRDYKLTESQIKLLPLAAKKTDQTVLIYSDSGKIQGILNVDPW